MSQPNSVYPPTGYANHVESEVAAEGRGIPGMGDLPQGTASVATADAPPVEEGHHE